MKKRLTILLSFILVLTLSLVAAVPLIAAPIATFTIGDISVLPGTTITVPVIAQDVDSSYEVCQAGIDLRYDPSVVTVTNIVKGDIPSSSFIFDSEIFTNDVATYQMDFFNVYSGNIIIAYITFQAVGNPGDSCELIFGDWGNRFLGTFLANYGGAGVSPLTFDDGTFTILSPIQEVEIDIKPGSDPNSINLKSNGLIPVAILTTPDFDATTIDASTVTFGPDAATMAHKHAHFEDINDDGEIDMVLHFRTQDTGISTGDTEACLEGTTLDGTPIHGCDLVRTVGKS